jgi:hypothetical protein
MRSTARWLVLLFLAPVALRAQDSGNGYLFGDPVARLNLRVGYAHANAGSDLFQETTDLLSLNKSDFSGPVFGGELAFRLSPRVDLSFATEYEGVSLNSHYRNFVDNNGQEIEQTTTFQRVPMTANLRLYLTPRGRSIGRLAWIPAGVVPWLGAGAGAMWYRFRQEGDFVDFANNNNVVPLKVESSGLTFAAQGMGGVDVTLTPRIALTGDARYIWAKANPGADFQGFQKIDLSGVSMTLGLTFRL